MLSFVAGFVLGGMFGIFLAGLCVAARKGDDMCKAKMNGEDKE